MTLYTQAVPAPPAGHDWAWTVPGNYIYDVTAVVATLGTLGGVSNVSTDASGNANTATWDGSSTETTPGIVPVDGARRQFQGSQFGWHCNAGPILNWASPWSVEYWAGPGTGATSFVGINAESTLGVKTAPTINITHTYVGNTLSASIGGDNGAGATGSWGYAGPNPQNPLVPHHYVYTYDPGTGLAAFYYDGVAVPFTQGSGPWDPMPPLSAVQIGTGVGSASTGWSGDIDELAFYQSVLSSSSVAAHYAARGAISSYTAAVMANSPLAYYHCNDFVNTGGRQVALTVASGAIALENIPTGFAEVSIAGPYVYSWQTGLQSSTQTAGGLLTTIAIPKLILPAGYVIGTDTLDIRSGDQWSGITIWWNSDVMDALATLSPYAYPPGAFYVYQQQGATP
jgi:hypothetical protein